MPMSAMRMAVTVTSVPPGRLFIMMMMVVVRQEGLMMILVLRGCRHIATVNMSGVMIGDLDSRFVLSFIDRRELGGTADHI